MAKVLKANCTADGIVQAEGFDIPEAENFGQGTAESEGLLILDEDHSTYFPKTVSDLVTTLDKIALALDQIAQGINTLDTAGYIIAVGGGNGSPAVGTPAPPMAASYVSQINSIKAEIDELKGKLK